MTRWKIIPTQRPRGAEFVYGSPLSYLTAAEEMSTDKGCQVLVVKHNPGETISIVDLIGEKPKKEPRLRRAA